MSPAAPFLNPTQAAQRLGVSAKALRLYEQRGLLSPIRSDAGWRRYGPEVMLRAEEIVTLRRLGLGLAQVGRVLDGDAGALEHALAGQEAALGEQSVQLGNILRRVKAARADLKGGLAAGIEPVVAFELPWPWGGERFELIALPPTSFITGPLGSGKTRLAMRLAGVLPNARFIGLDRMDDARNPGVDRAVEWVIEAGGTGSEALRVLLSAIEAAPAAVVVDTVEQGLDHATQHALIAYLRTGRSQHRSLVLMTRSSAILDLEAMSPDEFIIYCPANHSPPMVLGSRPGTPGHEIVTMCLATPAVRARTEGVIAVRPVALQHQTLS